jgi:prevent-host-death family protein
VTAVKRIPLSWLKDDLSRYLREAEKQEIIITRHGKPAGVLIGFESADQQAQRIASARRSLRGVVPKSED